jgi:hypothetical protein
MSLLDLLTQQIGGQQVEQISDQLGAPQDETQRAIAAALPILVGSLARNANASPDRAQSLAQALERDHDGSVLENLGGLLGMLGGGRSSGGGGLGSLIGAAGDMLGGNVDRRAVDGDGILGHVFGNKRDTVEQGVSRASGLDLNKVRRLLPILAPIVMSLLGRVKRQKNLDAGGLADVLGQERTQIQRKDPVLGGLINILDRDGDGNVMDDLGKLFNR